MRESGISGVINLLGINEQTKLNHRKEAFIDYFKENKINFAKNLPLDDSILNSDESAQAVFVATQYLDDMVNEKTCNVMVYSASGHTRATTVLIAYLHLY